MNTNSQMKDRGSEQSNLSAALGSNLDASGPRASDADSFRDPALMRLDVLGQTPSSLVTLGKSHCLS